MRAKSGLVGREKQVKCNHNVVRTCTTVDSPKQVIAQAAKVVDL